MSELTDKQKKEYIEGGYNHCPFCSSDNIESSYVEKDDNWVKCEVCCPDCGKVWSDIYTLADIY